MRFRSLLLIGTAMLFSGAAYGSPAATASRAPSTAAHGQAHVIRSGRAATTLYDQNNNDNGIGIISQNFEPANDAYDSQGADDFKVPAGTTWHVKQVIVTGYYFNGPGPAVSENVSFYKKSGTLPGAQVGVTKTVTGLDNGTGSFVIKLPTAQTLQGGLNGKRFWVSVQVNMDFSTSGEWGWETRNGQSYNGAAWQNPGDGFMTGCSTWGLLTTCSPAGEGPDFMFALKGTVS